MPEFYNPNSHSVILTGPDGKTIKVKSKQRLVLSEYFHKYTARGFIKVADGNTPTPAPQVRAKPKRQQPKQQHISRNMAQARRKIKNQAVKRQLRKKPVPRNTGQDKGRKLIVGRKIAADAAKVLKENLDKDCIPISNNIGVGILSFNRVASLTRSIESIKNNTDLRKTTIFISDDGSDDPQLKRYLGELAQHPNFVVLQNDKNLGVAGNSNRLLRCLSRFKYGILMNDDVEVLQPGWDEFYVEAFRRTGFAHFSFLQPGVYGASPGKLVRKDIDLRVVMEKPHGAVLAFTNKMLQKCGYFDQNYGQYGMEHVDWSSKPYEFGIQEAGFFDVEGSQDYFKLHSDASAVPSRSSLLKKAREIFVERPMAKYRDPHPTSAVPSIDYVIPFRNTDREEDMRTVLGNVRAQRFPVVNAIMVEQDSQTRITTDNFQPFDYYLAQEVNNILFNKSKAFNLGVSKCKTNMVVLHDADMLVPGSYTKKVYSILKSNDACHLGSKVLYADQDASRTINATKIVTPDTSCERVVGYFEGGSLACTVDKYWEIGGFNEDFWGYGCEDCEFYMRLARNSKWFEDRTVDFLHLWHGRADGWNQHHRENKILNNQLNNTPMPDRIRIQRAQAKSLGYPVK